VSKLSTPYEFWVPESRIGLTAIPFGDMIEPVGPIEGRPSFRVRAAINPAGVLPGGVFVRRSQSRPAKR